MDVFLMKFATMHSIEAYRAEFLAFLTEKTKVKEPVGLYEPISYILGLGGKRLRPVLTLMSTELFDGDYKEALDAALAVEIFHNFSLIHDDIMDKAPLRRGEITVHEKWDVNTGILSGDAMLIMAYQLFENYNGETFGPLAQVFSKTALAVCEGQQYDIDFETRDDVTIAEYLKMIEYKTAVLLAAAMKMGGIVAGASETAQNAIYQFGLNIGMAFQLQDDYLDTFGDPTIFGKQLGGDIIGNKKTYLYLKAMELATADQKKELRDLFSIQPRDPSDKIKSITELYLENGTAEKSREAIECYTRKAFEVITALALSDAKKTMLTQFGNGLLQREM